MSAKYDLSSDEEANADASAHVFFAGSNRIPLRSDSPPIIVPLHGGATLSSGFLKEQLPRLRFCDRIIANCSADVDCLRLLHPRAHCIIRVLRLPVDSSVFRPISKSFAKEQLGIPQTRFVVGLIGRLIPQKGIHTFIRLISQMRDRNPQHDIMGIIVGDFIASYPVLPYRSSSNYKRHILGLIERAKLKRHIRLIGGRDVNDTVLRTVYCAMDVYAQPSQTVDENFGYAAVEAMACGTPVIATEYGGLRDTVAHGETGYLIPTWATCGGLRSDCNAAIHYMERLLDPRLRKAMGVAALAKSRKTGSLASFQRRLVAIIDEAVAHPSRRRLGNSPLGPLARAKSLLPRSEPDWSTIYPMSAAYGLQVPSVRGKNREISLAGKFRVSKDGRVQLLDPAWPATASLERRELEILRKLRSGADAHELVAAYPRHSVNKLINLGFIVVNRRWS
ncbi:glycosyltransferase family 4 protein [Reyranella sp. MMS21-HV4-11]|uniref:Glycosyltransferase family 4 protein n=1 Tax=Reyranella humidisoli TaxID=2849149 RepID=A0ABS6IGI5_9HYPH|nr:glycosyltransferase family 4 protein [Reyranella sp. MMS21-HV4-11]MBU8873712.1 glycosyltransferase family 4 protein [Reyranella sp. MMS21-HV4-11]